MTRAPAKSYADREREFVSARMALAESGALLTEAIAARAPTGELDARVEADTRRYRAAERAFLKARRKAGVPPVETGGNRQQRRDTPESRPIGRFGPGSTMGDA